MTMRPSRRRTREACDRRRWKEARGRGRGRGEEAEARGWERAEAYQSDIHTAIAERTWQAESGRTRAAAEAAEKCGGEQGDGWWGKSSSSALGRDGAHGKCAARAWRCEVREEHAGCRAASHAPQLGARPPQAGASGSAEPDGKVAGWRDVTGAGTKGRAMEGKEGDRRHLPRSLTEG